MVFFLFTLHFTITSVQQIIDLLQNIFLTQPRYLLKISNIFSWIFNWNKATKLKLNYSRPFAVVEIDLCGPILQKIIMLVV